MRDRILKEATAMLRRGGKAAVSMRSIARKLKITPMALYHHFQNREALLQTVVENEFARLRVEFPKGNPYRDHADRIVHSADPYVEYALKNPRMFDYLFSEARPGARQYPKDFAAGRSPTLNTLAKLVMDAMEDGFLKRDDPWAVAFQLTAHVHGYIVLRNGGRIKLSSAEFIELIHQSLKRLLYGLKVT